MSLADGRGRWMRWDKKSTLDDCLRLDCAAFARSVDLTRHWAGSWYWRWSSGREARISYTVEPGAGVRLEYVIDKEHEYDYLVRTVTTKPNYGGVRWWWLCPACGQCVRVLYCTRRFLCRRCCGVNYYPLQQDGSLLERIDNRLYKIRRRLKANSKITERLPPKPKYMHIKTYLRLAGQYHHLQYLRNCAYGAIVLDYGRAIGMAATVNLTEVNAELAEELKTIR